MRHKRAYQGFTLLELIITIALLAILMGIAVPSFRAAIQNNRMTTQANDLVTAFQLARSEAIKRGRPVSICASDTSGGEDEPECGDDWTQGWMVFVDAENSAGVNAVNIVERIRVWAPPTGDTLIGVTDNAEFLRYLPRGNVDDVAGPAMPVVFSMEIPDCTRDQARNVEVARTGRTAVERVECT